MWASHYETLRGHGIRVRFRRPFFPQRAVKRSDEVAAIRRAGVASQKALMRARDIMHAATIGRGRALLFNGKQLTSECMKIEIERVFLEHGCQSGESIVACGVQASQPHNRGSGVLRAGQPIVVDIFPREMNSGYYFDVTRTFVKGTPTPELARLYDAVRRAQLAGLAAVKPGRRCSDVHTACADLFKELGFKTEEGEGFITATGHGLGLAIHEGPYVGPRSDDVLLPGMVITVEPGLYYKRLGGVRIEDTVLVTKAGCTNLTTLPKVFLIP